MPVYDVGAALDDCLRSIVEAGVPGIEIVAVDDASTGSDAARLQAWRARCPRQLRVITHPCNQGVSAARNTLLAHARGRYLWFVDPDDLVEPGALAALKAIVDSQGPDIILCDFRTFTAAGEARTHRAHVRTVEPVEGGGADARSRLVQGLFRTGQLHLWSKIVRREAWPAGLRFPAGRVFEDLAIAPRLVLAARTHVHVADVWIAYRQRPGSILATLDERKLDDWTLALTGYAAELRAAGLVEEAGVRFEVAHFCARTMLRAMRRDKRLPPGRDLAARAAVYFGRWRRSSPMGARELLGAYLRRGRVGRGLQWAWTLWRLRQHARR